MFPLAKILLPIDFSERCLGGARYSIPLVEHFHSELTLLHVISPIDDLSPEAHALNENRRKKAAEELDDFLWVCRRSSVRPLGARAFQAEVSLCLIMVTSRRESSFASRRCGRPGARRIGVPGTISQHSVPS